ncbi:hypothetical protein T11_14177 [Trichinella zimbabwensis]|uniref:Uncharacterized protein n=1 Tax=Trichinella zimbabwensis TaxID=268475 RepID=A0A0V1HQG4_9BILA|nr:hypothetical protein T11_14177 [Trichinella zimbabwensis]
MTSGRPKHKKLTNYFDLIMLIVFIRNMYNTKQRKTLRINSRWFLASFYHTIIRLAVNSYGGFLKLNTNSKILLNISSFHLKLPKKHIDQLNVAVHVQSNEFASANGIKEIRYFKKFFL